VVTVGPTMATTDSTTTFAWPAKAGARNSAADLGRLQDLHDLAVELGAACAEPTATDGTELGQLRSRPPAGST
jgi:hypothetical protein